MCSLSNQICVNNMNFNQGLMEVRNESMAVDSDSLQCRIWYLTPCPCHLSRKLVLLRLKLSQTWSRFNSVRISLSYSLSPKTWGYSFDPPLRNETVTCTSASIDPFIFFCTLRYHAQISSHDENRPFTLWSGFDHTWGCKHPSHKTKKFRSGFCGWRHRW
jgi:hypothetical protein